MYTQVKALKEGKSVDKPIYNHVTGKLDAPETIQSPKMLVRKLAGGGDTAAAHRGGQAAPAGHETGAWGHGRLARLAPTLPPWACPGAAAGHLTHITRRGDLLRLRAAPCGSQCR
jgi:hypothetical protein